MAIPEAVRVPIEARSALKHPKVREQPHRAAVYRSLQLELTARVGNNRGSHGANESAPMRGQH